MPVDPLYSLIWESLDEDIASAARGCIDEDCLYLAMSLQIMRNTESPEAKSRRLARNLEREAVESLGMEGP